MINGKTYWKTLNIKFETIRWFFPVKDFFVAVSPEQVYHMVLFWESKRYNS